MISTDAINALAESSATVIALLNVAQLLRDGDVKGFNVWAMFWWLLYGLWFVFYYGSLNQQWSRLATIVWILAYSAQTFLAVYYRYRPRVRREATA